MSHPSRVRELKREVFRRIQIAPILSHPSRVRELKHLGTGKAEGVFVSHPSRVRELKHSKARYLLGL